MSYFKKGVSFILIGVLVVLLTACGGGSQASEQESENGNENGEKQTIDMGQISWAENIAVTNMWKVILEDKGYEVNFHLLDMGTQMKALAEDELDINLEVWLPIQDKEYLERYQDEVNFSEEAWYDNAKVGLVVPTYMEDVNSIEDLNDYKDELNGEITGFDPGAGTMLVTEDLIEEYELDYVLISSSEPAMITALAEAIKDEKPIVAPLWNPHRVFSEMDLKYLDDPLNIYGEAEKIHHATRQGFVEDFPEVSDWIKNWKMDDEAIGSLMSAVNEAEEAGEEPIDGARTWVEENEELVNEWIE